MIASKHAALNPALTRSALHRCLQQHGISCPPDVEATNPNGRSSSATPWARGAALGPVAGSCLASHRISEVQSAEGKLFLFVGIDSLPSSPSPNSLRMLTERWTGSSCST